MGGFLSKNQWNLTIISAAAVVTAAILGLCIVPQARQNWPYIILYVVLYVAYIIFFYKAFSV